LIAAGYLPLEHQQYLDAARATLRNAGLESEFEYRGEIDREAKVAFLQELDVLSVPTTYREPKGLFTFEAMASGVPVVQPRHGAFPEIIERTGGGMLVEPNDPQALSEALASLRADPALAEALGKAGEAAVRTHYSVQNMAEQVEAVYAELAGARSAR
jgi:glycosyltransferase involved in cell wall biosynthesis